MSQRAYVSYNCVGLDSKGNSIVKAGDGGAQIAWFGAGPAAIKNAYDFASASPKSFALNDAIAHLRDIQDRVIKASSNGNWESLASLNSEINTWLEELGTALANPPNCR